MFSGLTCNSNNNNNNNNNNDNNNNNNDNNNNNTSLDKHTYPILQNYEGKKGKLHYMK